MPEADADDVNLICVSSILVIARVRTHSISALSTLVMPCVRIHLISALSTLVEGCVRIHSISALSTLVKGCVRAHALNLCHIDTCHGTRSSPCTRFASFRLLSWRACVHTHLICAISIHGMACVRMHVLDLHLFDNWRAFAVVQMHHCLSVHLF